jgi:arylsulfatase
MSKWAADRSIDFLDAAKAEGRPFFCLMSLFDPHDPYQDHPARFAGLIDRANIPAPIPPRADQPECVRREQNHSYLGRFADFSPEEVTAIRHGYAASIAFLDHQVGRVLAALDEAGLAGETLVIFMSDHGDQLGDHGLFVKGVALYEPTVGVPLVLRWPGHIAAGNRSPALAQGHDIAATCLAAAGLDSGSCPSSEDLVAMSAAGVAKRTAAICAYRNSGVSNAGTIWDPPMRSTMARNERFKLTLYSSQGRTERELFDLAADPRETRNLSGDPAHAPAEAALLAEIASYLDAEAAQALPRVTRSQPDASQRLKNSLR